MHNYGDYNPLDGEDLTKFEKQTLRIMTNGNFICKTELKDTYLGLFTSAQGDHEWLYLESDSEVDLNSVWGYSEPFKEVCV